MCIPMNEYKKKIIALVESIEYCVYACGVDVPKNRTKSIIIDFTVEIISFSNRHNSIPLGKAFLFQLKV